MRIGIDISQIVYAGTGIGAYTRRLVENLLRIDRKNEYILFYSNLRKKFQSSIYNFQTANAKVKTYRFPPLLLDFLWNRLHIVPIELLIGEIDIFISSDWTQPPTRKAKKVTVIHDLAPLKFPKEHHAKIIAVHKRRLKWVKMECDAIICVSRATKQDVINLLGIAESKIRVIYEGGGK